MSRECSSKIIICFFIIISLFHFANAKNAIKKKTIIFPNKITGVMLTCIEKLRDNCDFCPESNAPKPFSIYPNPAKNLLNIQLEKTWNERLLFEIIAVDGKIVQRTYLNAMETQISIKTEGLNPGLYFMRMTGNSIQFSQRFIVE